MGDFYLAYEYWFAAVQLALAMLGMGATLTIEDFRNILDKPRSLAIGTGTQVLLVPLVALLFISLSRAEPGVLVGLALLAAIPGGTVSNIFTYLARGSSSLSISITGLTTVASLVTTPLILGLLISDYMPDSFVMPAGRIAFEISIFLLLPLLAGMLALRHFPEIAPRVSRWSIRGSLFIILLIVIGASAAGRLDMDAFGGANALLVLFFTLMLVGLSTAVPYFARCPRPDLTAIQIEVAVRNTNLGLLINASLFPARPGEPNPLGDMVLFTLLLYGGVQLLVGAGLIWFHRRQTTPA
ncbi:bile acid:sodium symporter family protein [Parvularcula sp. IMCC14364]|uniref:bile acid:sodium symporter family protein n=1 Tax=Parvularcula sp. IMCC14364 TaxID=3067902 RepID=UPI002742052E|nr:bile acid:sodium symporter [Parvularcula sp. IMCC14364]